MLCKVCGTEFNENSCPLCHTPAGTIENSDVAQTLNDTPTNFSKYDYNYNASTAQSDIFTSSTPEVNQSPMHEQPQAYNQPHPFNQNQAYNQPHPFNQNQAFNQPHAFNQNQAFNQPHAFNQNQAYNQPHAFNQNQAYNQPHAFNQNQAFNQPHPFNQNQAFNQPHAFNQNSIPNNFSNVPPSTPRGWNSVRNYNMPPQKKKSNVVAIVIIIIIALFAFTFFIGSFIFGYSVMNRIFSSSSDYSYSDNYNNYDSDDYLENYFEEFFNNYNYNNENSLESNDEETGESLYPNGVSKNEYNQLQTGMTYAQISAIIGGDASITTGDAQGTFTGTWMGEYNLSATITIEFVENIAVSITQTGLF